MLFRSRRTGGGSLQGGDEAVPLDLESGARGECAPRPPSAGAMSTRDEDLRPPAPAAGARRQAPPPHQRRPLDASPPHLCLKPLHGNFAEFAKNPYFWVGRCRNTWRKLFLLTRSHHISILMEFRQTKEHGSLLKTFHLTVPMWATRMRPPWAVGLAVDKRSVGGPADRRVLASGCRAKARYWFWPELAMAVSAGIVSPRRCHGIGRARWLLGTMVVTVAS